MTILSILNEVAATSSRLEKTAILNANRDNETLKRCFFLAYDKQTLFWMTEAPGDESLSGLGPDGDWQTLDFCLDSLVKYICSRDITGHAAQAFVASLLDKLSADDREVFRRVINKDLKCGATASTANGIWKDLIVRPKFMLAETDPKKITYPAISDVKEDGTRGKFEFDGVRVSITSRNGNDIEVRGRFDQFARENLEPGSTLDGELVAFGDDGNRLPRKVGNGIVNKAVKGTISEEEASMLRFVAWDLESHPGSLEERRTRLEHILETATDNSVLLIESKRVNTYEEAVTHFKEARKRGLEGTIVKNLDARWQPKRSFDYVKFKAEIEAEFKVVGYEIGTGKNAGRVGALQIESECGQVKSNVGIFKDFDESVRDDLLTNMPKVVTILYNERIASKDPNVKTQSLFLPRVTALRWDKDVANTLEELLEIEKGVLEQ